MSSDNPATAASDTGSAAEDFDDSFESIGDQHRLAAHHFSAAARHHLAAAAADDEGLGDAAAHHAFLAYRHQLNGVQCAEIAVMDSQPLDDADDDLDEDDAVADGEPR